MRQTSQRSHGKNKHTHNMLWKNNDSRQAQNKSKELSDELSITDEHKTEKTHSLILELNRFIATFTLTSQTISSLVFLKDENGNSLSFKMQKQGFNVQKHVGQIYTLHCVSKPSLFHSNTQNCRSSHRSKISNALNTAKNASFT